MISDHDSKLIILGSSGYIDEEVEKIRSGQEDSEDTVWFGDEMSLSDFFGFVSTPPLFNNMKSAVVHNADKIKDLDVFMEQTLRCPEAVIILTADAEAEKKLGKFQGFKFRIEQKKTRKDSISEVQNTFEKLGLPCNSSAAEEIHDIFAGDIKTIRSEAEKFALYYAHSKPETQDEILKHIASEKQENIFTFIDRFASRERKNTIRIMNSLIKSGETMNIIFVLLARRMKQIYIQKNIPSALQERAFIISKIKSDAVKWKNNELSDIIGEFADLDYKIKTGQIRDTDAIYHLIGFL